MIGERFYALLTYLYPPVFRERFGHDLRTFHAKHRRDPRFAGWAGAIRFWWHTVADVVRTATTEWASTLFGNSSAHTPQRQSQPRGVTTMEFARDVIPSDLRMAVRGLARNPGFTAIAVFTLALGLGGSAAIYTLLDRVVLDPLPYPESERLVQLTNAVPGYQADAEWDMSTAQYVYFTEHASSFDGIGLYRGFGANIETPEGPHRTFGWRVTASVFPLLGATAHLGRVITVQDDRPGAPDVAVLSNGFWRRQFGSDPNVIGRAFSINGTPIEIIGVLEPGVRIPDAAPGSPGDIWIPQRIDPNGFFGNHHVFPMIARLVATALPEDAETELANLTGRLPERFPIAYSSSFFEQYGFRTRVTPLKEAIVGEIAQNLWIIFGGVGLVLLIAVANVANLFLVRLDGRRHELSVRRALGANRWIVVRHLLAESCTLAFAGGVLALLVGVWGVPALVSLAPDTLPRIDGLTLDLGTVAFTLILSLVVGFGIALYPVMQRGSGNASQLVSPERSATLGRERQRVRAGLVVAQVALALTLLTGAGLLLESMHRLNQVEPGLDPVGVVTAGIFLTPGRYANDVEIWTAYREMLARVRAIPSVDAAGMTSELPVLGGFGCTVQAFEDKQVHERLRDAGMTTCAGQEPTAPGYFEAMGIPVLRGRAFTDGDNDYPTRASVVVSLAFAERFWPGEDPIGKGVMPSGRTEGTPYRVIGVVGDVPAKSLDGETAIAIYYPVVHNPNEPGNWDWWFPNNMSLVVKTSMPNPLHLAPQIRRAVQSVDPTVPVAHVASMETIIRSSIARFRFTSVLLGISAGVALLLAAVGLYGVVSYVVSRRTREIGIRIAIGARPSVVSREVVRRSLALVASGLAAGLVIAVVATRAMRGLLYDVEPTHPTTFLGAVVVLAFVASVASWIPARRAARVDPVEALRAE